jgi:hypothetical protein
MGHDKDNGSSVLDRLPDIGDSNHILWQLDSREVLLILVILINDLCQFPPLKLSS